jgi:hypothetical protein
MWRTALVVAWVLVGAASLTACGGGSSPRAVMGTQGLRVTPGLEAALLAAGAAAHHLPVRDYVGLAKGMTYYALDGPVYWAAAKLVPRRSSGAAQRSVQDDGAYDVFTMYVLHGWTVYDDGLGTVKGTRCAIVVPTEVRITWHWSPYTPCGGPPGE